MKMGMHNFQVCMKKMLVEWGVVVPEGGDMHSTYNIIVQKDLWQADINSIQVYGKKMLYEWGVVVPEGGDVHTTYQNKLLERGEHGFLKVTTRNKNSKQERDLALKGENNLQNLSEESKQKRDIKRRLTKLDTALVEWEENSRYSLRSRGCQQTKNVFGFKNRDQVLK